MKDKQLPCSLEAEQMVIGTCLCVPDAINSVITLLTPGMFYDEGNRRIYTALVDVAKREGRADLVVVTEYLKSRDLLDSVGGIRGLMRRSEKIVTDHYLQDHARVVREKYILREYIFASSKLTNIAYGGDVAEVVEFAESTLFEISNIMQQKEPRRLDVLVDEYLAELEKVIGSEKGLTGVPSGFMTLDRITGGWQPSDLVIIAGRPSMGKTAVALSLAWNAARLKFPVAFFSLEMSESQLTGRLLAGISGKTNTELRRGNVDFNNLALKSNSLAVLPFFIDDTPALSIFDLRSKVKKLIMKEGIKLVIVDYLQLMTSEAASREQEVSKVSRGLKAIAKEFDIPVIALSQLNREVEARAEKQPRLSDLRESGAIEQDADMVCFIYRPAVYGINFVTVNGVESNSSKLIVFDIAKNRNGALASIPLYHNDALTLIRDEILDEETIELPF